MTWTVPEAAREQPPNVADERTMLDGFLDFQRQTLLVKSAGLTAEQFRTASVEPSALSLLGLVRHMAEVERFWFRMMAGGEALPAIYSSVDNADGDFDDVATADPEADLATYAAECAAARAVVAELSLDHVFQSRRKKDLSLR
jgi:uncharacterized damage-inducible protein DinB